jgi:hypothetical protein
MEADATNLMEDVGQLLIDLAAAPQWYARAIAIDEVDPDDSSVSYNSEGHRRVIGNLGNLRALARVTLGVQRISDLLLEDEGPPTTVNAAILRGVAERVRRDTLADAKRRLQAFASPLSHAVVFEMIDEMMQQEPPRYRFNRP